LHAFISEVSLPKPGVGADGPQSRHKKTGTPSPTIAYSPSDRLHVAIVVALIATALVALAFPLTDSGHVTEDSAGTPVLAVSDGFSAALESQAQTLAGALTQPGPVATPEGEVVPPGVDEFLGGALVPRPLLVAAVSAVVQGALAGPEGQASMVTELQQPMQFTLHEEGFPSAVFSTRPTVGGALSALGADYNRHDRISPPPDTPLAAGLHVFVEHATAVNLKIGGDKPDDVYTHANTVAELLDEHDVELSKKDSVIPALSTYLRDGMAVTVTFIGEKIEVEDTPIPFATIYHDDPTLMAGEYVETQAGVNGFVRREYAVVYENGVEVSRKQVSEFTVLPTYRIVSQGTAVPTAAPPVVASTMNPECGRILNVWATWYTAASAGGSGTTATGTTVKKGTVAVDPSVIPLGTRMYIPGYGYGVAEDTGGGVIGNFIDLGYGPDDVYDWSSRYVDICILD
jgi:uncharacterized protein YabE (DUF348 family)